MGIQEALAEATRRQKDMQDALKREAEESTQQKPESSNDQAAT